VPQNVRNIFHRRAGAQQSAGNSVPENVNPCASPSASSVGCHNRLPDDANLDRFVVRGNVANKYPRLDVRGRSSRKKGGDRGACRDGQREDLCASALGSDEGDRSVDPVDVFEA
jgi:hypothetical protein